MKQLTPEQVQARKDRAVRFVRMVLDDTNRATEIENESLEDYAERRRFQIVNPQKRILGMATKQALEERIRDLEQENEELQSRLDEVLDIVAPQEDDEEETDED